MTDHDLGSAASNRSATSCTTAPRPLRAGPPRLLHARRRRAGRRPALLGDSRRAGAGGRGRGTARPREIGAWLHVGEDGAVTVYTGKVEVGQNIRTSLTQVVAEELRTAGRVASAW